MDKDPPGAKLLDLLLAALNQRYPKDYQLTISFTAKYPFWDVNLYIRDQLEFSHRGKALKESVKSVAERWLASYAKDAISELHYFLREDK